MSRKEKRALSLRGALANASEKRRIVRGLPHNRLRGGKRSNTRPGVRSSPIPFAALLTLWLALVFAGCAPRQESSEATLRIYDWTTGEVYVEAPARAGSRLFFGWMHSLEKIPWNEYYHIDASYALVLDAITFPAFGAGIPEDKGRVCYIKDGLIHMEDIDQLFQELVWLNSHTATRDILLDDVFVTRGSDLPHHARLRLVIEKK